MSNTSDSRMNGTRIFLEFASITLFFIFVVIFVFQGISFKNLFESIISLIVIGILVFIHFFPQRRVIILYQLFTNLKKDKQHKILFVTFWALPNMLFVMVLFYSIISGSTLLYLFNFPMFLSGYLLFVLWTLSSIRPLKFKLLISFSQLSEVFLHLVNFSILSLTFRDIFKNYLERTLSVYVFLLYLFVFILAALLGRIWLSKDMMKAWPDKLTALLPFHTGKELKREANLIEVDKFSRFIENH